MRVESGSQNLSRIDGHYLYRAPRYNNSPVESVESVRARTLAVLQQSGIAQNLDVTDETYLHPPATSWTDPSRRSDQEQQNRTPFLYGSTGSSPNSGLHEVGRYLNLLV